MAVDRTKQRKTTGTRGRAVDGETPSDTATKPSRARTSTALARHTPKEVDIRVRTNRYGVIKRHTLRERILQVTAADADPMDLTPEAQLLRALVVDYVEDYDTLKAALIEWYSDREEGKYRVSKPVKLPELSDVAGLIGEIGKLISRQHTINQTGTISLAMFRRACELMGEAVATYVHDPEVLSKIETAWGNIAMDPKSKPRESTIVDAEVVE